MHNIVFRVDGNANIGLGHIMRCLSIADAMKRLNNECIFITADDSYNELIKDRGYVNCILGTDYKDMESEINQLKNICDNKKIDIIIIDSYFVTDGYFKKLKDLYKIVYLDDIKAFPYDVDVLINYNIYARELEYETFYENNNDIPNLILGPEYVPLRKEFQDINPIYIKKNVNNVLFSAGGSDPEGIVVKVIEELIGRKKEISDLTVHFILGSYEPDKQKIIEYAEEYDWIKHYENVKNMSELMLKSDIAISAAGSTLYELCACGVPTITYVLEDNQEKGAKTMEREGIMKSVGDYRVEKDFFKKMINELLHICENYEERYYMSKMAKQLIDGNGAVRLAKLIQDL